MLRSVKIRGFKNWGDGEEVIISDDDTYAFTLLAGKNGAGKSSVLDAIEWAALNRGPKGMRAGKADDLVCEGMDSASVTVTFETQRNDDKRHFSITREHRRGGRTQIYISTGSEMSMKARRVETVDTVARLLRELCDIDSSNIDRVLVKQQNASSIACAKPKELLDFMEKVIGTDKIASALAGCVDKLNNVSTQRLQLLGTLDDSKSELKRARPDTEVVMSLITEKRELNKSLRGLYIGQMKHLQCQQQALSSENGKVSSELGAITDNLRDAVKKCQAAAELYKCQLKLEKQRRSTRDRVSESIVHGEDTLEQLLSEQKKLSQKGAARKSKATALRKSVSVVTIHDIQLTEQLQ
jgi:chromosome segregation protein